MDKEKYIVPSVVSLHVRASDDKDSLKNLFNSPDNSNNRRLSYNLVRIYNTSYNSSRNKPVSENLPPYLANVTSYTHSLNSSVINCRFNSMLRRNNADYPSLFPNNKPQLVSQFWSNSMRIHQTEENLASKRCTSPSLECELQKNLVNPNDSKSKNSIENTIPKQNPSIKKKTSVVVRLEQVQENSIFLPTHSLISKSKPIENQEKYNLVNITVEEPLPENRINLSKNQIQRFQNSLEKQPLRKQATSFLQPIKERATTASFDSTVTPPPRSQTSVYKTSTLNNQKSISPSLGVAEAAKNIDGLSKRNNSPLLTRLINTQSNFMSNTQFFPYPDPCELDNSGPILARLNELSALESETVRWEKSKVTKRRPRVQIESM